MVSHAELHVKQSMAGEQKLRQIIVSQILFAMILFHNSCAMNWFATFLEDCA